MTNLNYVIVYDIYDIFRHLRHISEKGNRPIIHKKSINNANRRPPVVINSYPENDKLHEKFKKLYQEILLIAASLT